MKSVDKAKIVTIIILFLGLVSFFPIAGKDIFWTLTKVKGIEDFLNIAKIGFFPTAILLLITKYKFLKVFIYTITTILLFLAMKNIANKKNNSLLSIAIFFFLLLDRNMLSGTFVSNEGFAIHILGSLYIMTYIYLFSKEKIQSINPFILFVFGIISGFGNVVYSTSITLGTIFYIFYLIKEDDNKNYRCLLLSIGQLIGLSLTLMNTPFIYNGISHNLLEVFIPNILEKNFLITIVFSSLVMFSSIKNINTSLFRTVLAIFGMSSFLFSSLLSKSIYLNYITFIIYTISSFYILLNVTTSRLFQKNIYILYIFKIVFISILATIGYTSSEFTLILYLIDILVILELYNHIFPIDFLNRVWYFAMVVLLISNIYIYMTISKKYDEMNFYIKNRLECTIEDINIPTKFKNEYLKDYIPYDGISLERYAAYYRIDIYDKKIKREIKFRE